MNALKLFKKIKNLEPLDKAALAISLIGIILIVAYVCLASSCSIFKPDSWAEEVVEEVIKDETGLDLDLSPSTPEKN